MGFEGATVSSARLHIFLESQIGTPFTTLGPAVHVEQVNYDSSTGAQSKHENIDTGFDALISDGTEDQWKIVDVTDAVQDAIDLERSMVQFRLKHNAEVFAGNGNNQSTWAASGIDQAHHPYLEVTLAP